MSTPERPLTVIGMNTGLSEGPVFLQNGPLITVSIDRGHILATDDEGQSIFAITGLGPNGLAEGNDGTVYVAMCGRAGRRPLNGIETGILAVRPHGRQEWVTTEPIAPNDLCFGPDGYLYFTDPSRGRRDDGRIWRVDVTTGSAQLLVSVDWYPNGIGFGLEDDALYVADTSGGRIVCYELRSNGLGPWNVAAHMENGVPDGFAFDVEGNLVTTAQQDPLATPGSPQAEGRDDIQTYSPSGELIDAFTPGIGGRPTNVALNAERRLVITTAGDVSRIASGHEPGGAILAVDSWAHPGLPLHPFR